MNKIVAAVFLLWVGAFFAQSDDETVYLLKKQLFPHIDSHLLVKNPSEPQLFLRKNIPFLYGCNAPFLHGVASGDPTSSAVILWTRWTPPAGFSGSKAVHYEVSSSMLFSQLTATGTVVTDSLVDYTVKIDVGNLNENAIYYYRFFCDGDTSVVGRTKTLSTSQLATRLAFVNCNDYTKGYFNSYKALADRNDVDAVFHLGDYIYEQGGGVDDRAHHPNAEIWQLNDYRTRYSQYKLDNYLNRCHQLYPFVQIWDDHDIVVDAVSDTSLQHQAQYGSYQARKWAAVKAFREWNPVRDDSSNFIKNWRKFSFGSMVDVFVVDDRLYQRDRIPTGVNDTLYNSQFAKMLGPEQLSWLLNGLQTSTAKWKIIANGLMFSQFQLAGVPFVLENWDGYSHERNELLQLLKNQPINNVIVYSGDFHCAFAINVSDNPYNFLNYNPINGNGSLAVEFIPPSASSDNFDEGNDFGLGAQNSQAAQSLISVSNAHMKFVDLTHHGYGLLDLNAQRAQNEFWFVNTLYDASNTSTYCANVSNVVYNANKVSSGSNALPFGNLGPMPQGCFQEQADLTEQTGGPAFSVLSCFPSPFSDVLSFQLLGEVGKEIEVSLVNLNGQKVLEKEFVQTEVIQNFSLEVGQKLASGLYVLRVATDRAHWTKRVVKE